MQQLRLREHEDDTRTSLHFGGNGSRDCFLVLEVWTENHPVGVKFVEWLSAASHGNTFVQQ